MTRVLPYSVRRVLSHQFISATERYLRQLNQQLASAKSVAVGFTSTDLAWFRHPIG